MDVTFHRAFKKELEGLPKKAQQRFYERLDLWLKEPGHALLHTHPLKGDFEGYWSLNVTGDYRAVYKYTGEDMVVFARIGTHSELYGA